MTRLAKLIVLGILAVGPTAAVAQDYSGTFTGPKGGTSVYSGSCAAGEASVNCSRDSLLTGPKGYTATRKLERQFTDKGVSTRITTTGQFGRTVTTTRERLR